MTARCYLCGQPAESVLSSNGINVCKWCTRANSLAIPDSGIVKIADDAEPTGKIIRTASVVELPDVASCRDEWTSLYKEIFNQDVNLSGVRIPQNPGGYDWVLFLLPGMTTNRLWATCRGHFSCHSYIGDAPDIVVPNHERTADNSAYAIRVRPRIKADEELKNVSADTIKKTKLTTMTLPERLFLELWYSRMTGKRLDFCTATLCAGSRGSCGRVPRVGWDGVNICVSWGSSSSRNDFARARSVVL